jgi:hypothetical protein
VLEGPRLERDRQVLSIGLNVIPEGLPKAGQERRRGCGNLPFVHVSDEGGKWDEP